MTGAVCRFCAAPLDAVFTDLGSTPVSNSFLKESDLNRMEPFYPLKALVCGKCLLVQLEQFESPRDIFSDEYAYFSSFSDTWLAHCQKYARMVVERFGLGGNNLVMELASNDGYLLQYFKEQGVPCMGVEPAANVARAAIEKGIDTLVAFFGVKTAEGLAASGKRADLLIGNNVLAHVPDLNDFVGGMKKALNARGVITMEFPHLLRLMEGNQFDTIYHEHFSYFSFGAVSRVFEKHGLKIFDVEEIPTHGGSLRIYATHYEDDSKATSTTVTALMEKERAAGLTELATYLAYTQKPERVRLGLLEFLIKAKRDGKKVAGYGAPAKGNTLLNYCGVRRDLMEFTVDKSPHKQGMYLPGTRIPIHNPRAIGEARPDYVLILPWNIRDEIMRQMGFIREWGGKFVTPIPEVKVWE
ncbi:MAG: class I SAM-dependent methyltransferase [Nitrospinae bacterium]|nr:class I SAM-dependent methyltransferase [Nitrospinota bacterium]